MEWLKSMLLEKFTASLNKSCNMTLSAQWFHASLLTSRPIMLMVVIASTMVAPHPLRSSVNVSLLGFNSSCPKANCLRGQMRGKQLRWNALVRVIAVCEHVLNSIETRISGRGQSQPRFLDRACEDNTCKEGKREKRPHWSILTVPHALKHADYNAILLTKRHMAREPVGDGGHGNRWTFEPKYSVSCIQWAICNTQQSKGPLIRG